MSDTKSKYTWQDYLLPSIVAAVMVVFVTGFMFATRYRASHLVIVPPTGPGMRPQTQPSDTPTAVLYIAITPRLPATEVPK